MDGNHLMYSSVVNKVMTDFLSQRFPRKEAQKLLQAAHDQYLSFLPEIPNLGGNQNGQAQSVYDCIALFAFYEILPQKPSLNVFEELVNQVFTPQMKRAGCVNLNSRFFQRIAHRIFSHIEKKGKEHEKEWIGNYHMEVEPYDKNQGIRYRFTSCPIADFAKSHGYSHLMPAMCNPDYDTLKAIHAGLIRTRTCGSDDCCDYWIVGDKSPLLDAHPLYEDDFGYLRNK